MKTLIQISDPHLSPRHGFFHANFMRVADAINAMTPHLVVSSGDLSVNGPEAVDDLAFARWCHGHVAAPVLFLPGNHDVGEEPGGEHLHQPLTDARMAAWREHFGADRWVADLESWRLVGLNSQLFNTGMAAEATQWEWLTETLDAHDGPFGLFLHKPVFDHDPDAEQDPRNTVAPEARERLLVLLDAYPVRFVASGHRHQRRILERRGVRHIWCPSTAFMPTEPAPGCDPALGLLEFRFERDDVGVTFHAPDGLEPHILGPLKENGRHEFLKDVPPRPVDVAWR
ncbi:MAG: metallophosphoesterase [Alphaproteobacteria bacterium]|nr:metallophosphoesterase [Alphaproteobacteria bacterium]